MPANGDGVRLPGWRGSFAQAATGKAQSKAAATRSTQRCGKRKDGAGLGGGIVLRLGPSPPFSNGAYGLRTCTIAATIAVL